MGMIKNFLLFNLKRLGLRIQAEAATGTHTEVHLDHTRQLAKSCYSLTSRENSHVLQSTTAYFSVLLTVRPLPPQQSTLSFIFPVFQTQVLC